MTTLRNRSIASCCEVICSNTGFRADARSTRLRVLRLRSAIKISRERRALERPRRISLGPPWVKSGRALGVNVVV